MAPLTIEQALLCANSTQGIDLCARSPGFEDAWVAPAQQLCTRFGLPSDDLSELTCVFAKPLTKNHVAVVQVAHRPLEAKSGRPKAVFRLLVIPLQTYIDFTGDPFSIADQFVPLWNDSGALPTLTLSGTEPRRRRVEEIQTILQRSDGPTLLGTAQALVDASRVVFEKSGPDESLIRSIWQLLPDSTRCELWPTSFAFGNELAFDVLVASSAQGEAYSGYLRGDEAENYPEGRYELHLQIAAEDGDQGAIDGLFGRRSRKQTLRLCLYLLAAVGLMMIVMKLMQQQNPPPLKKNVSANGRTSARLCLHKMSTLRTAFATNHA